MRQACRAELQFYLHGLRKRGMADGAMTRNQGTEYRSYKLLMAAINKISFVGIRDYLVRFTIFYK
jgi:hypothetical protein